MSARVDHMIQAMAAMMPASQARTNCFSPILRCSYVAPRMLGQHVLIERFRSHEKKKHSESPNKDVSSLENPMLLKGTFILRNSLTLFNLSARPTAVKRHLWIDDEPKPQRIPELAWALGGSVALLQETMVFTIKYRAFL